MILSGVGSTFSNLTGFLKLEDYAFIQLKESATVISITLLILGSILVVLNERINKKL